MNFVAIDIETANFNMSSICQIGLAKFSNGLLVDEWTTLVNPDTHFADVNISVHGIQDSDVLNAPYFNDVYDAIIDFVGSFTCVSHTRFDQISLSKAINRYNLSELNNQWLDSAIVARRTWNQFAQKGYSLDNLAKHVSYNFKHHDALEDAKAAGYILVSALNDSGLSIDEWLINAKKTKSNNKIKFDANENGALFGESIVFTGSLSTSRNDAKSMASLLGCVVSSTVTKKTTILVVGDQDLDRLGGKEKSSKHLRAEELIQKGQQIKILGESDFKSMVKQFSK